MKKSKKKRNKKKTKKTDFICLIVFIIYILLILLEGIFIYGKEALIFYVIKNIILILCFIALIYHLYKDKQIRYLDVILSVIILMTIMLFSFKSINCFYGLFNEGKVLITNDYIVDLETSNKWITYYSLELNDINETVRISNNWYQKLKNKDNKIKVIYWKNTGIIKNIKLID